MNLQHEHMVRVPMRLERALLAKIYIGVDVGAEAKVSLDRGGQDIEIWRMLLDLLDEQAYPLRGKLMQTLTGKVPAPTQGLARRKGVHGYGPAVSNGRNPPACQVISRDKRFDDRPRKQGLELVSARRVQLKQFAR